jgi:hypothetical protein
MKTKKHITLNEVGKELPFKTPDNYFVQFAQQIDEQIGYTQKSKHKFIRPWMYIAAISIGIIMSPIFYSTYQNKHRGTVSYESYVLTQVDETVMMDYFTDETIK